jgi:hypothetical protein
MNAKVMFKCLTRVTKPFIGVAEKELQMKQQQVNKQGDKV